MKAAIPSRSATAAPKAASLSKGAYLWPQAEKVKRLAAFRPSPFTTKFGPASRAQLSSIGTSKISIPPPSIARASAASAGFTAMQTGSNSAIACATFT